MLEILILVVFPGLVLLAATTDMFTMTIPNKLCLSLVACFFVTALLTGMPLETLGWHVALAFAVLLATFAMFAGGFFGGGDAKFSAAIVLWLGPGLALEFVLVSAVLGGMLTMTLLMLRSAQVYVPAYYPHWATRLLSNDVGVPYGIALSAATMILLPEMGWFQMAIGI